MAALSFLMLFALALMPLAGQAQTHVAGGGCAPYRVHVPDADVAYRPGVDAQGWAVAPPDLHRSAIDPAAFDSMKIDLDVPASAYTDHQALRRHFPFAEIDIGEVEVNRHGSSKFNGRSFNGTEIHVQEDCAR